MWVAVTTVTIVHLEFPILERFHDLVGGGDAQAESSEGGSHANWKKQCVRKSLIQR